MWLYVNIYNTTSGQCALQEAELYFCLHGKSSQLPLLLDALKTPPCIHLGRGSYAVMCSPNTYAVHMGHRAYTWSASHAYLQE